MHAPAVPLVDENVLRTAERRTVRHTWASYLVSVVLLVAATVVMSLQFTDNGGIYLASMVGLGALVLIGVLTAIVRGLLVETRHG